MSTETFEILEPGLLTTVQDRGRYGYQRFGVPVSGAMDEFALRAANILVSNDEGAAGLEMTVVGPKIRFLKETWIAVTGGDLAPVLDGEAVPPWQSVKVSEGRVLSFGGVRDGVRSYLAVAGGIDVAVVMGSRSTYLNGGFGGLNGRALKAGDIMGTLEREPNAEFVEHRLPKHLEVPFYGHQHEIRVVLGPQDRAFASEGTATFLGSTYSLSIHSDRMGYRLEGPLIEHLSGADIVSDGTPLGAVQVPGDGIPLIMLADRGTTGGYAKIATVIGADISRLAQAMPEDTLTFKAVTLEEAHAVLREREEALRSIVEAGSTGGISVVVEGQAFEVVDDAGHGIALPEMVDGPGSGERRRVKATVDGRTYEFDIEVQKRE